MRLSNQHCALLLTTLLAISGIAAVSSISPALAQMAPMASMAPVTAKKPARAAVPSTEKFSTAAAAAKHCPGDIVVWSTFSKSKAFHLSTSKLFGKTKHGAYVCEKDAVAAGYHASKN